MMVLELVTAFVLMNALFAAIVMRRRVGSKALLSRKLANILVIYVALNDCDRNWHKAVEICVAYLWHIWHAHAHVRRSDGR